MSIMHGLAGEAANPRPKHRAAQLVSMSEIRRRIGGSILCLAIQGSHDPSETQQAHHLNAEPHSWSRTARGTRMKKPRSDAGLFPIPIPPSGALPPGGTETLPDAAKTPFPKNPLWISVHATSHENAPPEAGLTQRMRACPEGGKPTETLPQKRLQRVGVT